MPRLRRAPATIANGASLSDTVKLMSESILAIEMPAAWTAANLTFQAASDSDDATAATFNNVYDEAGVEYTVTAAASRYIMLDPSYFLGAKWVKVRSGTSGAAVNQGAQRVIGLVTRELA